MRKLFLFAALVTLACSGGLRAEDKAKADAPVQPMALLGFEERGAGAKDLGPKVADLLFAKLVVQPELFLVDRAELKKVLEEQALGVSGAVKAGDAAKVGQLTGARLLVTGSVIHADKKLFLVAKVIGTETGRVFGASAEGNAADELAPLVAKLSEAVVDVIAKQGEKLVPKPAAVVDRIAALNKTFGKAARPIVVVTIPEKHVGSPTIDPAAQTEISHFAKETGFELIDLDVSDKSKADVVISGEAFSEAAGRVGSLVSVRARVEIKAVDRKTGKVLAVDRQTAVVVELTEQVAGKAALQEAAALLAERVLPKLVVAEKK